MRKLRDVERGPYRAEVAGMRLLVFVVTHPSPRTRGQRRDALYAEVGERIADLLGTEPILACRQAGQLTWDDHKMAVKTEPKTDLTTLERRLQREWCRETSADPEHWSGQNPAWGQCAVTALIVQDTLGGEFLRARIDGVSHYWNRLPSGENVDLTRHQFVGGGSVESETEVRTRDYVLSFPETRERYECSGATQGSSSSVVTRSAALAAASRGRAQVAAATPVDACCAPTARNEQGAGVAEIPRCCDLMHLCLSSGHRPRYRRDIVRTLAMPAGSWIQFRYAVKWIAPTIASQLDDRNQRKKLRGTRILIAYVDQADLSADPEIVPCRYAKLVDVVRLGHTSSLQLELGAFAHAEDLAQVNEALRAKAADHLPRRVAGEVEGCYWVEMDDQVAGLTDSRDPRGVDLVVGQLAPRSDFREDRFFYTVADLVDLGNDKVVVAKDNLCKLRPSRTYDLEIYHYHPTVGDPDSFLSVTTSADSVSFAMTPEIVLDSKYDLKRVRLRTAPPAAPDQGVMTLWRRAPDEEIQSGSSTSRLRSAEGCSGGLRSGC